MKAVIVFIAATVASATLMFPPAANALNKKLGPKSYIDARHCLDLPSSEAIIRCAEQYM